jgi:hypothetical protein
MRDSVGNGGGRCRIHLHRACAHAILKGTPA